MATPSESRTLREDLASSSIPPDEDEALHSPTRPSSKPRRRPSPPRPRSRSPTAGTSAPCMTRTLSASPTANATIYGVLLVGFDHALGPTVEFTYPRSAHLVENEHLHSTLPFLALPDGAHARDEDYTYFHLHCPQLAQDETVFGISCNRQITASQLLHKGKDVTRSTVQKAIVVLASKPIFGPLRNKLDVVTRSFFAQRDFSDKSILVDLYRSFKQASDDNDDDDDADDDDDERRTASSNGTDRPSDDDRDSREAGVEGNRRTGRTEPRIGSSTTIPKPDRQGRTATNPVSRPLEPGANEPRARIGRQEGESGQEEDAEMYMGTFLRELVHKFRFKTLMLLKLLMLQKRVLFFSTQSRVEQLCTFQYSLVALIPALLPALQDAASPVLSSRTKNLQRPTSLKTSDKASLLRYLGLPLEIFGEGAFFQPYLPLQQIGLLSQAESYLVGTTNSIIQQQRDCKIDVVVN
ncbi:hypothetical protein JCM10212_001055, partial [Sporobolomyces blumeae]